MISLILAGGKGVRLWPESRESRPKQLCSFFGDRTMLQHTVERLRAEGSREVMIITNRDQQQAIERLLYPHLIQEVDVVGEPVGKNTAPALGLALAQFQDSPDEVLAVFPSDHYIRDEAEFHRVLGKAEAAARRGYLVTVGIVPGYPETGYGYIRCAEEEVEGVPGVRRVSSFTEKPDEATARRYLEEGGYFWNAGIFVARVDTWLEEFARHLPSVYEMVRQGFQAYLDRYHDLPEVSLDYGIAEKSSRVAVVPGDFGWSDVGSWKALAELLDADAAGNVLVGDDIIAVDSRGCLVRQCQKTVALLGAEDLVVVETEDVIFVCPKHASQEVRRLVDVLRERGRHDLL